MSAIAIIPGHLTSFPGFKETVAFEALLDQLLKLKSTKSLAESRKVKVV